MFFFKARVCDGENHKELEPSMLWHRIRTGTGLMENGLLAAVVPILLRNGKSIGDEQTKKEIVWCMLIE